ncbi:trypsin-like serine protease [Photobacterium damselae subsp. damselae]|uniref:trypsin-like serine peptidase n=1 Tax=Photobacterium damselae TaxID=38293 RepID=UPI0015F3C82C|nr:trypsin-like serine protease [Photobacterium damselae]MBA5685060.1 trypsin-like serine protease [Photobacterium damselae subsp. damselae]
MKQISLLALAITSLFSVPSYAVEDGVSLSWDKYPYIIESQCTGTVIAGKYILLAGHCGASIENPFPRVVNFVDGSTMMPVHRNAEPYYQEKNSVDIALWTLPKSAPMNTIAFIDNLNDPNTMPTVGDKVSFIGFGQNDNIPRLGKGINSIIKEYPSIFIYGNSQSYSVLGDSGAPVFNEQNKIIAVNYAGAGSIDRDQNGVNLRFVKDWLLQSINAWHSPTELKFTGSNTIEIQSLHVNNTNLALRQNNGALSSGDVTVTGGSCITDGDVTPFGTCTLELSSTGGEGHIMLDDGNTITINRAPKPDPQPEPKPDPQPKPDGGKSGGSMGYLSLLGLLALAFKRKK